MARLLLWLVLGVVLAYLLRGTLRHMAQRKARSAGARPPQTVDMRQCAQCGVHVPQPDLVTGSDGREFCSQAHLRAANDGR